MYQYRWIIIIAILWIAFILLDEVAYQWWKQENPGARWSNLTKTTAPLVDPSQPPQSGG